MTNAVHVVWQAIEKVSKSLQLADPLLRNTATNNRTCLYSQVQIKINKCTATVESTISASSCILHAPYCPSDNFSQLT